MPNPALANAGGITPEWLESGGFGLEIASKQVPVELQLQAFYDPCGERVRG